MGEQPTGSSKFAYVLLAVLFIALIVGATAWFYLTGRSETQDSTATTETTTTDPQQEGDKEIATALEEIDSDLAEITSDEESEDDTVDF